ncbi:MAG TPA: SprT family zinc-dependent metalloprotease [Steroidobacteraceae bacterium]|nr:SprT family zinc-dependent metalloprotease [Steroidobacteraceae bacterium]
MNGRVNGDGPHLQLDLLDSAGRDADEIPRAPRIRVSRRARRLAVRVYPDARVEVVVPLRTRPREVERFLAEHREWIDDKRAQALRHRPAPEPFPPASVDFAFTRERWRVHVGGGEGRMRLAAQDGGQGGLLHVGGKAGQGAIRKLLRQWLMQAAQARLAPAVARLAAGTGVRYARVSIRRQRSRWGSCSARGTISLNVCLLFQRPEVVEYLIIHELMHVKHMNHSPRFWRAVEQHCPGWRALDRELLQGWRRVPRWIFSDE